MQDLLKKHLNTLLENTAINLDISDSQMSKAKERYSAIGEWLGRKESILYNYTPSMYPQGSFLLGTVIRPLTENDEFDVDLVCEVKVSKEKLSQKVLKDSVGHEVKEYNKANNFSKPTKEGKRCWTLEYSESATFHMDILPAVPDGKTMKAALESYGFDTTHRTELAIAITDNTHKNYNKSVDEWPVSNPRGYADWFKSRMTAQLIAGLEMLSEARKVDIQDIPEHEVKTPLQRAIQILKRHRDIMFQSDQEHKPISIIITTLAAHSYNNENNIFDTIHKILSEMDTHILTKNDEAFIPNPVNPMENFADKWQNDPRLKENFYKWLKQAKHDFNFTNDTNNIIPIVKRLQESIGKGPTHSALRKFEDAQIQTRHNGLESFTAQIKNTLSWLLPKYKAEHKRAPEWPEMLYRSVYIRGEIKINGRWQAFDDNTGPLPKGCALRFFASTDAVGPYQVYWQIVNTGKEAADNQCLRGNFEKGKAAGAGGLSWSEETSYSGLHWVECFIVKDAELIARSGPFEVNIS